VTIAAAGHPLPLRVTDAGDVDEVAATGRVLGLFEERPARDHRVQLEPGDALVLFTDGVIDARHGKDRFGTERLAAFLRSARHRSAEELATSLREAVDEYQDGNPQDDLALLVIQVPRV
jgi:serine phosphatase RsbU (regulator of sigma subunit)